MFTVLSTSRKNNPYLIIALAILLVLMLSLAVAPSMAVPKSAVVPVTGVSEYADYFQRHPKQRLARELNDLSDYLLRH